MSDAARLSGNKLWQYASLTVGFGGVIIGLSAKAFNIEPVGYPVPWSLPLIAGVCTVAATVIWSHTDRDP